MFDDFLPRGLFGGIGVAIVAGPLGCLVVWQWMSYFGAAIAHAALLGVAFRFLFDLEPLLASLVVEFGLLLLARAFASPRWRKSGSEP